MSELPKNPDLKPKLSPKDARQDYGNFIIDWKMTFQEGMTRQEFIEALRRYGIKKMPSFSEQFPPDKYPGIITNQPPGVVERFDAIAQELTDLLTSKRLTIQRILELESEIHLLGNK